MPQASGEGRMLVEARTWSDRTTIDLRKLFNITQPGSYLFSVEMPRNGESQTAIESQPLRLNIYP